MANRVCRGCGEPFETKFSRKEFCSIACLKESKIGLFQCVICGEYFRGARGGRICCSDSCSKIRHRQKTYEFREKNKDHLSNYSLEYKKNNPEKVKAQTSRRYDRHREKILQSSARYRDSNIEKIREYEKNNQDKFVRSKLRRKLGFEPDDVIIELALLRRSIGRAIKKAGE